MKFKAKKLFVIFFIILFLIIMTAVFLNANQAKILHEIGNFYYSIIPTHLNVEYSYKDIAEIMITPDFDDFVLTNADDVKDGYPVYIYRQPQKIKMILEYFKSIPVYRTSILLNRSDNAVVRLRFKNGATKKWLTIGGDCFVQDNQSKMIYEAIKGGILQNINYLKW